jgi:hypothetical protein
MSVGCSTVGPDSTIMAVTLKSIRRKERNKNFLSDCPEVKNHQSPSLSHCSYQDVNTITLENLDTTNMNK